MTTWHTGRQLVTRTLARASRPVEAFLADIAARPSVRVPGTGVFMTARDEDTPPILVHHLKHNKVLHERVVLRFRCNRLASRRRMAPLFWRAGLLAIAPRPSLCKEEA